MEPETDAEDEETLEELLKRERRENMQRVLALRLRAISSRQTESPECTKVVEETASLIRDKPEHICRS